MKRQWRTCSVSVAWVIGLVMTGVAAQDAEKPDPLGAVGKTVKVEFTKDLWDVGKYRARETEYRGKKGFRLDLKGLGGVFLKGSDLENGVVEVDLAASGTKYHFPGILFRAENADQYECVYFRPLRSGKKTGPLAIQYFPAYSGEDSFRVYSGPEYDAPAELPRDGSWFHVRIEFFGTVMKVYLDRKPEPALVVNRLLRTNSRGEIGIWSFGTGYFANLEVTKAPASKERAEDPLPPKEYLSSWKLSKGFNHRGAGALKRLTREHLKGDKSTWRRVFSDHNGLMDLMRFTRARTAVFAVTSIHSDKDQSKTLLFDHAIRLNMFLNGKSIYAGENKRLRDGRLNVQLPLRNGTNELFMAVIRQSGLFGLGFVARIDDLSGITLEKEPNNKEQAP